MNDDDIEKDPYPRQLEVRCYCWGRSDGIGSTDLLDGLKKRDEASSLRAPQIGQVPRERRSMFCCSLSLRCRISASRKSSSSLKANGSFELVGWVVGRVSFFHASMVRCIALSKSAEMALSVAASVVIMSGLVRVVAAAVAGVVSSFERTLGEVTIRE